MTRLLRPADDRARLRELESRQRASETAPSIAGSSSRGGTTVWQDPGGTAQVTAGLLADGTYGIQANHLALAAPSTGTDLTLSGKLTSDSASIRDLTVAHQLASGSLAADHATLTGLYVGIGGTQVTLVRLYSTTLTPSAVAAATSQEKTFTLTGLSTADVLIVNGPAPTAGCPLVHGRVSATDTLALVFANVTAGSLTPASGTYLVLAFRG